SFLSPLLKYANESFELTDKIKNAYEVGLNILKPSKYQLEHGLELHKNSIIFDAYGFIPRAAIDGTKIAKAINENASFLELRDMKENMAQTRFVNNPRERNEFINAWDASGVTCLFQNSAYSGNEIYRMIQRIAHFTYVTDMMETDITKSLSVEHVLSAKQQG